MLSSCHSNEGEMIGAAPGILKMSSFIFIDINYSTHMSFHPPSFRFDKLMIILTQTYLFMIQE